MFQALKPLLAQCKSLDLKLATDGDTLVVIVIPVPKDGENDAALRQPIKLQGTAAELDAGFTQAVASIAESRTGLLESVAMAQAAISAAKAATDKKTVAAVHGKGKSQARPGAATPGTTPALRIDDDGDTEGDATVAPVTAASAAPAAAAAAPSGTNAGGDDYGDLFSM